jgi:radical SAM superfamily enzyme YgiQ (UPF0313 family)
MRIALVSTPRPRASFINRDLYGGMGIDDNFGTEAGVSFVAFLKAQGTVIPELAFPYLAALLGPAHDVRFFDGARTAEGPGAERFAAEIEAFAPALVIASTSYAHLRGEAGFVAALGARTGARTVLFGYAADWFGRDLLARTAIDLVVSGEVEGVAPPLVAALAAGTALSAVPGLWLRDAAGAARHTGRHLVADLDALPFPDWRATHSDRYHYFPLLKKRPFVTLLSSRGCTYCCDYCPYWVAQGAHFRARAAENVAAEMEAVVRGCGARSILFRDPSFGLDRRRVVDLCRAVVARGLRVDWGCETRLDGLDDEVIAWLARAGCRSVEVGMDSLSPEAMRQNRRRTMAPAAIRDRLRRLTAAGIASAGLFVIGLPGDTEAAIRETIRFANDLDLTYVNYEIPVPFPGTPLYDRAVAAGQIAPVTFEQLAGRHPPLPTTAELTTERLLALQNEGMRSFYVRPGRVLHTLRSGEALASARFLLGAGARFLRERYLRRTL